MIQAPIPTQFKNIESIRLYLLVTYINMHTHTHRLLLTPWKTDIELNIGKT